MREANFLDSSALPAATFDALIEHTCYCAIEPIERHAYMLAAAHTLKPGGLLLGAFLEFEGGGPPFGTSRDELLTRFGAHFEVVLLEPAAERFLAKDVPQLAGVFRRLPPS